MNSATFGWTTKLRDARRTELLRVDDPVGAGLAQLRHAVVDPGPGDDEQVRVHRPAGQRHVQVGGIGRQRDDEGPGGGDAGGPQRGVERCVTNDDGDVDTD